MCEFCSRVSLAGFLTAVFFICFTFLASMIFKLLVARQISKLSASKLFTRISSALIAAALIAILWLSMALYSVSQVGFSAVEYAVAQIGGSFVDNAYSVIGAVASNFLNIQGSALTIFLTIDSILTIYFWLMLGVAYYLLGKDTQSSAFYIYSGLAFMCTTLQFIDFSSLNSLVSPYALLTIALLIPLCELAVWARIKNIALARP
ncbi:hypothetical protein [uncultured Campylobacter sp.]|uniref:hypothetical protein n=1 Tax=uncultured Campylobacter sp. TaxID=218934 RepID=UPI00260BC7FA|nr:hypothetical protein [uncultured Campylobacter sp.]